MAADRWSQDLHDASWGDLALEVAFTRDSESRALVHHKYPHVDGADLEDVGGEPRATQVRIIFFGDDYYDRYVQFLALRDSGDAYDFVHPITGTFKARVEHMETVANADERDCVVVECTFVEDSTHQAVISSGAGAPKEAALEDMGIAAAAVDDAVVQVNDTEKPQIPIATTVGDDTLAKVQGWYDDATKTVRDISLDLSTMSNGIDAEMDRLSVMANPKRWQLYRALVHLRASLYRAAQAFTRLQPAIIEITVPAPLPLLIVAQRVYGASEASQRYAELLKMNDVPNPARVPTGTILKGYAPDGRKVASLRVPS